MTEADERGQRVQSAAMSSKLLALSATELARRIRAGELRSRQVVDAHIAHIEWVNPSLNALVRHRFEDARREADEADRRRDAGGSLPPLHGVPCTIKECFEVRGLPQTGGLHRRKDHVAPRDAPTVARLREAGAIPLGITNVSELCMWMESDNPVYGRTNNPHDPARTVGGSSGGEGALVGAGASPFGLGSDIGGSIRMPAFFNGVFGHKPTGGLVPNSGQFPTSENDALRYQTVGPLCRRAEDLPLLVSVLAGPDGEDPACRAMELGDPGAVDLSRLRVLSVPDDGRTFVSAPLRAAQAKAAAHLAKLGAKVEEARFEGLRDALEIWASMLQTAQTTPFTLLLGNGEEEVALLPELARFARGEGRHSLPALALGAVEKVTKRLDGRARTMCERGRALRAALVRALGEDGVMLYPSYATVAPRHRVPMLWPFLWVYTAILNVMELPVTQVPLGLDAGGLPLGVQVAATHGNDHLTMAVALELERAFGGFRRPARFR
jgi:fatty acid amide hydrolase 2